MRRWALAVVVLCACGGDAISLQDYPAAFKDAYCRYLTRCGAFPDVETCQRANIGFNLHIDASSQAAVDMGTVLFDGETAAKCLDELGSQTCDQTDASGRSYPEACNDLVQGTVAAGGACAFSEECTSRRCDIPACTMACCQGTCTGDAPPPPGGPGTACTLSSDCQSGTFCDFTATPTTCTLLKTAGATCQSTNECAYGLGCAGTTTRTCKELPALGEPCPDGVCRDAGNYCSSAGTCAKIGLSGASCTDSEECSPFYPCDPATRQCTQGPGVGEPCPMGTRCFDADAFCDTAAATPTCAVLRPDGGACASNAQCESDHCDQTGSAGTCTEEAVCI